MGRTTIATNQTSPKSSKDYTTNQNVHMERPMALAAYVAEYGLIGINGSKALGLLKAL